MPIETTSLYDQAHAQFMAHANDPVFRLALEIYLGETFQQMATYHQGQIQAIADQSMYRELGQVRKSLTKHYLTSRLEEIQKKKTHDFTERYWHRNKGRFAAYNGPKPVGPTQPHWSQGVSDPKEFLRRSWQDDHSTMTPEERRARAVGTKLSHAVELPAAQSRSRHAEEVWERTAQMHNDLFERTSNPADKQRVQYVIQSPDGKKRIEIPKAGELPEVDYHGGERVHFMTPVGPDNPVHAGGKAINIGLIAGMSPEQAAKVGGVTEGISNVLSQTSWGKKMQATASTIAALSGGSPVAVQAAAFAHLVNVVGPQASRAFGGKIRQLTYRYSGQEAAPEDWSPVATAGRQADNKGELEPTRAFEMKLITDLVNNQHALPTRSEYNASLQVGSTPPSKGYILDKDGKVVSEATGFSDDWYTPFNLKRLPNLRGGSYVRTRAYGGLTPEDIRLAMRTGAQRVSVVSNNGVFTMELNPKALHWGHRWGFAGGAMVRRYTKSLDAIKNSQINVPNPSGAGADTALTLNAQGYKAAMEDLRMKYPYWVVDPRKGEGVKDPNSPIRTFHEPLTRFGLGNAAEIERQGDPTDNDGYVSPLNTRAHGAKIGWAEPGVGQMSMWEDPVTGKHAYHDFDRYKLQEDLLNNIRRTSQRIATGTGGTGTGGTTTARSTGTPTATARPMGGGRTVEGTVVSSPRSYGPGPREEHVDVAQVGQLLKDLQTFVRRAKSNPGAEPFDGDSEFANEMVEMMTDFDRMQDAPGYKDLRDRLANNKTARDNFISALGDHYGVQESEGKAPGWSEMYQRWTGLEPTDTIQEREGELSDEDQGAMARAEEEVKTYRHDDDLPLAEVQHSNAVSDWFRGAASEDQRDQFETWIQHRRERDNDPNYQPWKDPNIGKGYRQMNRHLANLLSRENEANAHRAAGVEPVHDTGERTTASATTAFVPAKLKQDARGNPETAAKALFAAITAGRSPEDAGVEVAQTIDALRSHGRRSNDAFFSRTGAHMEDIFAETLKRGGGRDDLPSDDEIDRFGREHGLDQDWG